MEEASRKLLHGFTIRADAEIIRSGDRYRPEKGLDMWLQVLACLAKIDPYRFRDLGLIQEYEISQARLFQ